MKTGTDAVLLRYFEETASSKLTLQALLRAAEKAFTQLLDADAVCFFTARGKRLRTECAEKIWTTGWPEAPPGIQISEKIRACMADDAGRSVCVYREEPDAAQWWLFPLAEGDAPCGAAVCRLAATPDGQALSGAERLARAAAPAFCRILQKEGDEPPSELTADTTALLSHEFKTPLTVALSSLQLLRRKLEKQNGTLPGDVEKYLDYTEMNLYKALRLVMNLVEAQYVEPGGRSAKLGYTDMAAFLREMIDGTRPYARVGGVEVTFENRAGEPCGLVCDAIFLEHIMLNLLSNALKHTPAGGTVYVILERAKDALMIHTEDEGPGIPPEAFDRLFQKFWRGQNEHGGSGLGLYLSQRFAQSMGGTLRAENRPQGGARFTLCLPTDSGGLLNTALHSAPLDYQSDSRDALLRIEFSEWLSSIPYDPQR